MKTHDEMIRDLYARRDAYELQKQKRKRKIKRTAVRLSCIAACFAVCLTVGLGVYQETKAPDEKTESSETTQQTPSDSAGESEDDEWSHAESSEVLDASSAESSEPEKEIPEWLQAAYDSYAVAEIVGVTDETVTVDGTEYTKVNCNVMQTYRADAFAECDTMYIVSPSAQQIDSPATVFFELQELTVDGKTCYTTTANENGAVCLSTEIDKTIPSEDTFFDNAQSLINKLNESVCSLYAFLKKPEYQEFIDMPFERIVAPETVADFFTFCNDAAAEYEKIRK
ncbi:MAG: hypothetical protein IJD82_01450 [Clostridia bacterium]|nr:hypothetical protein [Clostridia bacterium]